jgi:type IV pilus assembly protein PilB
MAETISNPLLSLVKEQGLIDDLQLDEVLQEQTRSGKGIEQILNDFGIVETETQLQIIASHLGTEVVELTDDPILPEVIALIPNTTARMYQCLPLEDYGSVLRVALGDPMNPAIVDELGFIVRKEVQVVVADRQVLERLINRYYPEEAASFNDALKELESEELADADGDAASLVNEAPIVRFVNLIIFQAVQDRASDIHFEPFEDEFKIRYRVDGALYEMAPPPKHLALPVISRIKIMANLNISERRIPQDGRIAIPMAGKQVDLRVSTLPTQFGESVVLRVLDRSAVNLDLEALGLPRYLNDYIKEAILQPNGIFIVTGPTGSGKTTTLYSCL